MIRPLAVLLVAFACCASLATAHDAGDPGHQHDGDGIEARSQAWHDPQDAARLVIDDGGDPVPWTHLNFRNDAENFQFLIVSDRTGGHRPGVFPEALRKARLLQPEFIMSVGDLIEGYTDDESEVNRQWDEFTGFFVGLDIPFFYVPGNHDLSNPMMARVWEERFGRAYYHFLYRDVLFLCLNSEDGRRRKIGDEQVAYFRRVLERHDDVRWTLVFLHRPLWVDGDDIAPGWLAIEDLLAGREYTVFAGHFHTYTKHLRKDRRYIVLATTGGGSGLGGPDSGQFDHVVWVTMTAAGPVLVNLLLDGVWDEDIFTTQSARLLSQLTDIRATPLLISPGGAPITQMGFRLVNEEDIPMLVSARAQPHPLDPKPWLLDDFVPPNSVADFRITVQIDAADIPPDSPALQLTVTTAFNPADHRPLMAASSLNLAIEELRPIGASPPGLEVDGKLDEWPELAYQIPGPVGDGAAAGGAVHADGQASFALSRDETMLYLAARVTDDRVITHDPPARLWQHDYLELRIDPRPFSQRERLRRQWDNRSAIYLACFPGREQGAARVWRRQDYPEAMQAMQRISAGAYEMELAIPLAYLRERGGASELAGFSLNLTVVDLDDPEGEKKSASWQPDWHRDEAVVGAGSFIIK